MGMVFQDPMTALNPLTTIGWQIEEPMDYHMKLSAKDKKKRTLELLRRVGIKNEHRVLMGNIRMNCPVA